MIVDVREIHEFEQEHIPGAINLPLSSFSPSLFSIPTTPEEKIILICRTNKRSNAMKQLLLKLDLVDEEKLFVYEPGMIGWIERGRPVSLL